MCVPLSPVARAVSRMPGGGTRCCAGACAGTGAARTWACQLLLHLLGARVAKQRPRGLLELVQAHAAIVRQAVAKDLGAFAVWLQLG